ncbi:Recombination inhibitory protein MutS2, partial [hydrothermal vent metagenome]
SPLLKKLEKEGAYLIPEELLKVRETLAALAALAGFTSSREYAAEEARLPITTARLNSIETPPGLKKDIDRIIDPGGELRDEASPRLSEIRRGLRNSKQNCRKIVDGLLRDKELSGLFMEDYFTVREDRFVVCVKSSYYTQVPGIVHGRSASGETYFIEPLGTVEINNRVSILKRDERAEVVSILQEISGQLFAQRAGIFRDIERAAALDLAQAKARFKEKTGGTVPELNDGGPIRLIGARHPILVLRGLSGAGDSPPVASPVVPVDITLDEKKRVLVISGANTGGKTVALKTLGLLVLMAESALPVPACEGSELPFFRGLYADIGDRQSIDEELSTFSAHLKRSAEILRKAGADTLVLLDEIGVGTDPAEGGALSLSILESLAEKGATVVVTTHLNLLKAHSAVDDCFENASVLFDETTSSPLYKLRYGMPGASLALAVAEEYGIPRDIVERARKSLKGGEGAFVESLSKIDEEKKRLEALTLELQKKDELKDRALKRLRDDRSALHKKARLKIEAIVERAGEEIKAHAELVKREREEAGRAAATHSRSGVKAAMRGLQQAGERAADLFKEPAEAYEPAVGDLVVIAGSNARGEVVAIDGKRAEVLAGNFKVWAGFDGLRRVEGKEGRASRGRARPGSRAVYAAKAARASDPEYRAEALLAINIVGLRVDEALPKVERALDDAHMAGGTGLEIIHGSGTGALRSAVRKYLDGSVIVSGYKGGDPLAGGEGVTIVELK